MRRSAPTGGSSRRGTAVAIDAQWCERTLINRRDFLTTTTSWLAGLGALPAGSLAGLMASPPRKPNILLILADDMGYAEMGVQGNTDVPTPNIDAIARNGVRFTSGYVSGPVCAPTAWKKTP